MPRKKEEYIEIREVEPLEKIVSEVLASETKAVLDYRGGSREALDYLITQVLKRLPGKADPKKVRGMIVSKL